MRQQGDSKSQENGHQSTVYLQYQNRAKAENSNNQQDLAVVNGQLFRLVSGMKEMIVAHR